MNSIHRSVVNGEQWTLNKVYAYVGLAHIISFIQTLYSIFYISYWKQYSALSTKSLLTFVWESYHTHIFISGYHSSKRYKWMDGWLLGWLVGWWLFSVFFCSSLSYFTICGAYYFQKKNKLFMAKANDNRSLLLLLLFLPTRPTMTSHTKTKTTQNRTEFLYIRPKYECEYGIE